MFASLQAKMDGRICWMDCRTAWRYDGSTKYVLKYLAVVTTEVRTLNAFDAGNSDLDA
jgi:hypothetical protein